MKKAKLVSLAVILVLCLTTSSALANDLAFEKYPEPVTVTMIRSISNRDYVEGESWDDNIWTRQFEEELNIVFDYIWTCDSSEFNSKLNLAIATGDLADMMYVPYDVFYRMAQNGMLADLTDAYETYVSDGVRENMQAYDGLALEVCTLDGKLYGLTSSPSLGESIQLLWYRDDWAANLGLERPETWEDVVNMMYAFAQNDPNGDGSETVGIGLTNDLFGSGMNLKAPFAVYGAYPQQWIAGEDGQLVYGGIQEEAKEALKVFAPWYKDGIIDSDFVNLGAWAEGPDDIVQGKVGLALGETWFGDWQTGPLMANVGWDATWTCMLIPGLDGETVLSPVSPKPANVLCSVAGNEHPEALVKLVNLSHKYSQSEEAEAQFHDVRDAEGNTVNTFFYTQDIMGSTGGNPDWNLLCAEHVGEALESGDPSNLTGEERSYYDRCLQYLNQEDPMGYASYSTFGPTGGKTICYEAVESGEPIYHVDAFYGPSSDNMSEKWGNITSKQTEVYTRIIMGSDLETEWDSWVAFFNTMGGEEITADVNAWYATVEQE